MIERLLDANFNRAREALRVLEDLVRFGLDDPAQKSLKALRHRLSALERPLGARLLSARDVTGDVGRDGDVPGGRSAVEVAGANFKRAQEALRSIEEAGRAFDPALSRQAAAIRYDVYALEASILPRFRRRDRWTGVRLYVLLDARFGSVVKQAQEAVAGGAEALQLRTEGDDRAVLKLARILKGDALLIVNDRADIAAAAGADGVHLGGRDLPLPDARRLLEGDAIVGATSHSLAEARAAVAAGADYVSCGPVFPTTTKPGLAPRGLGYLGGALKLGVPVVCIGGITPANVGGLVRSGARCVAVCAAVAGARDVRGAARAIRRRLPD